MGVSSKREQSSKLERALLSSNVILECFGNAMTVKNANSSRYGKFVRIEFDQTTKAITGARLERYLLEKSRVCHRSAGERNFHVLHQVARSRGIVDPNGMTLVMIQSRLSISEGKPRIGRT